MAAKAAPRSAAARGAAAADAVSATAAAPPPTTLRLPAMVLPVNLVLVRCLPRAASSPPCRNRVQRVENNGGGGHTGGTALRFTSDQTLRFLHRCSWNIFEDGDLKCMHQALIAPSKNLRRKFCFLHPVGPTKTKQLSMTLIWTI